MTIVASAEAHASPGGKRPPALLDNMDHTPVMRLLDGGAAVRVLVQSVERGQGRFGAGCERVVLTVPGGVSAPLAYDIPPATVIEELTFTAWVSCNRPGTQLAATVVLPRSIDPRTGAPRRLLLRSGKLAVGGDWRLLTLENLPALLADQARVARAMPDADIDEHEAYVSQLIILVPGGPGTTEVWIDQIAVHGIINRPAKLAPSPATGSPTAANSERQTTGTASAPALQAPNAKPPAVPRIIQWQGEPLKLLQDVGFDAVWMGRLPNDAELAEASALGMFLVCPPPPPAALAELRLDAKYERVIAWDLGQLIDPAEVAPAYHWASTIEQFDPAITRPVLLHPSGLTREASRIADVVVLGRPTIGATQTWTDYAAWLSQQRRTARPGVPAWCTVDTHISSRAMAQLAALRGIPTAIAVPASFNELALATTAAFGVQPRGFCFTSQASLAANDADTRMRLLALELTNLRLALAEPWLAAGKAATVARSKSHADITGLVLKVERSHLVVPLRWSDAAAGAADREAPVTFLLPGIPESSDAYLISISGSLRLQAKRVTGGLEITVDRLPDDAFLLVTEDGYAFSQVERRLRQHAPRAAQARIELAALRRQRAAQAIAMLAPAAVAESGAAEELALVDRRLTAVVDTMQRRDYAAAYRLAAEAEGILDRAEDRLGTATASLLTGGVGPVPVRWSTLPDCAAVTFALQNASGPPQLMPGGNFESVEHLSSTGWQRIQNPPEGIEAAVRLSPEAPAQGSYCLELDVQQTRPGDSVPAIATPPVWVTSPPLQVPPGRLVEISGMARMVDVPLGSPDPLLIFDSIGGEESAIRITSAPSWTPFRLIRAVPPGSELRVTVALGGVGKAQLDSIAYRYIPLNRPSVAHAPR